MLKTSMRETAIEIPPDRQSSFESVILPKHKHDVSDIENKVLAMYARSMSQRDICAIIDDIYGFKLNAEQISKITDYVLEEQQQWQNRTLAPFYPFLFVDCLFVPIKRDYETKSSYTILLTLPDSPEFWHWNKLYQPISFSLLRLRALRRA